MDGLGVINRYLVLSILLVIFTLSGCASYYTKENQKLNLDKLIVLPDELEETSGLYCSASELTTLNDSGNSADIFHLTYTGSIVGRDRLALINFDWEAVSASDTHWYVADLGNNKGSREQLSVYKIDRSDLSDITTLSISYEGNEPSKNIPYAHDYDSEAMVKTDDKLLLFSKSWQTGIAKVYAVDESVSQQHLQPFAAIKGLPGVITGADYDKTRDVFVVVGYKSDPFGNFAAFMAQLNTQFEAINIWPLSDYKQVEGVCVDADGAYWFTEESTKGRKASLTRGWTEP